MKKIHFGWVEDKSLARAIENYVIDFLYEHIFTHFGVPREIVTDHGEYVTSNAMKYLVKDYIGNHCKSSPYRPQENGKVESTNKVLEAILTNTVQLHHKDSVNRISEAL